MKIKKQYYCLVDKNNKPDFRYLFASKKEAYRKLKEIKNSTTGETLFVSKYKRDFFVDGVKKGFIGKDKLIQIKKGCWVSMLPKKVSLLDTIDPEELFQKTISSEVMADIQAVKTNEQRNVDILRKGKVAIAVNNVGRRDYFNERVVLESGKKKKGIKGGQLRKKEERIFVNDLQAKREYFQPSEKTRIKTNTFPKFNLLHPDYFNSLFKTKAFVLNFVIILVVCLTTVFYVNHQTQRKIVASLEEKQKEIVERGGVGDVAVLGVRDDRFGNKEIKQVEKNKIDHTRERVKGGGVVSEDNIDQIVFSTLQEFEDIRAEELEEKIMEMVAGTPMEKMAPYIARRDKIVAAFLVGIAKKESNYGRRVPVLNGQDCYNYWGYRGIRQRMGTGGHTCFDSPEDAVKTVGDRIERLVKSGVDTPEEMVLWKCGSDCNATGGWVAAHKWIRDVDLYFSKMLEKTESDKEAML